MNIEEIIYSCNNEYIYSTYNPFYNIYSLVIKKYLLNLLINKKTIEPFEDCINYFIKINDINFKDSLEDLSIAKILYDSLNDKNLYIKFHKNEIIILDSYELFQSTEKQTELINYSLENVNLEFKLDFNFYIISNLNNSSDIISYIDNTYNLLTGFNNCIFNKIYKKVKSLLRKRIIEINKRIKEISLIIKRIYKLVLNENINICDINRESFINSISIILIIKLNYDKLIQDSELNDDKIKEILLIFNGGKKSETQETEKTEETEETEKFNKQKNNILNVIKIYNQIYAEFGSEDIIELLEKLFNEYDNLKELLEDTNENQIENLFINFVNEIKEIIELNEKILEDEINILKEFIKLTTEIIIRINDMFNDEFNEYYNLTYYENLFKIQLINFKKIQVNNTYNNLLKLNNELKEMSHIENGPEVEKILEEVEKEIQKNKQLIISYDVDIQKIKELTISQSEEDDILDEDLIIINKNIDELIYFYNEKQINVGRNDIIELFEKCGIQYSYVKFNNIIDIFKDIDTFIKFINTLSIIKKDISKKNIKLFLILFNFKISETYETYVNRIKEEGLTFYNNKFKLNIYEVDNLLSKIGFFIKDLIEKIDN